MRGAALDALTTQELAQACRIFLDLAYPDGPDTIPANKLPYYTIASDRPISDFLLPAPVAVGVCQDLSQKKGGLVGYEFRLGCASYPHLKLRIQVMNFHQREVRVYSVDTHDGFVEVHYHSPDEAEIWRTMVDHNRVLKNRIEEALRLAGMLTPKYLLRLDLT